MGHRNSTFRCPCLKNRTTFHNTRYCKYQKIVVPLQRKLNNYAHISIKQYK